MRLRRRSAGVQSDLFPGFVDVTHIGGGRFSSVYRAREVDTDRTVALKLLTVHEVSAHALDSFRRETMALGPLSSHPNIVTLYRTFATPQGMPVLVLELCRGSVADRVRAEGPLAPSRSVSVAIKIAGALETAHRAGVLHRDVKPQNILVTEYDEPALADFGLARLQSSTETTAAIFAFTTRHAAPELLEGSGASAATDVYELASSLYQLMSGRAAFRSYDGEAPASVILRILRDPVEPLMRDGVPMTLSDLLVQAMAKDPSERPTSMKAFAEALCAIESQQGWPRTAYAVLGHPHVDNGTALPASAAPADVAVPVSLPISEPVVADLGGAMAEVGPDRRGPHPEDRQAVPIDDLTATEAPLRFVDGSAGHAAPKVLPDLHGEVLRRIPGASRGVGGGGQGTVPDPAPARPDRGAEAVIAGHPCAKGHVVMVGEKQCRRCGQAGGAPVTADPEPAPAPGRRLEWDAIESAQRAATPAVGSGPGNHDRPLDDGDGPAAPDGTTQVPASAGRRFGGRFTRPGPEGSVSAAGDDARASADGGQEWNELDQSDSRAGGEEAPRRGARLGQALPGVTPHFYDPARPPRVPGTRPVPLDGGTAHTGVALPLSRGSSSLPPFAPLAAVPVPVPPPSQAPVADEAPVADVRAPRPGSGPPPVRPSRQAPGMDIPAPEGRKAEGKRGVSGVFRRRPREDPPAR